MPQYDGLAMKHIAAFLENGHEQVFQYLPDAVEIHKISKEWICNVCATVLKGMFTGWIKNRIEERNAKVAVQKDLMIKMDPEMAAVFQASTKTSR